MYLFDLIIPMLGSILLVICVMVGVAFLTLLERKLLGYIQIRKGPNKLGYIGILQPFSDAIKLFTKEQTYPMVSNYLMYYMSPIFSLFLALLVWMCIPFWIKLYSFNLGIIFFFSCVSLGVYTVMLAGWSSNSNYALLGGLRAVAQTISYEVSLILLILSFIFLINSFNFFGFMNFQQNIWFMILSLPLSLMLFTSLLAETNRTPFDFAEGESELVSGFNVEYSSGGFALIFLAEYASILFMSMLFVLMFLGANIISLFFYFKLTFLAYGFIWVRGTLPRYRYDKLMYLVWKNYLPASLCFIIFFIGLKIFLL
nr:NADH dehydrogenase subunit 1 [Phlebotomus chinensis]WPV76809.1 NADH dehydrogenase subunit 1 [Phlebotomus chinensis]WPV76822.1 NADH dehydrogenase subunit 1 [Phlebotomus chinensis]WPV76835.1 NADH dehydrogenase subunit 1 [Phlebotomus chinensis]WPV76848.1 NADH dehydrogenase subunit 1 [Phlebotomus chinensis]